MNQQGLRFQIFFWTSQFYFDFQVPNARSTFFVSIILSVGRTFVDRRPANCCAFAIYLCGFLNYLPFRAYKYGLLTLLCFNLRHQGDAPAGCEQTSEDTQAKVCVFIFLWCRRNCLKERRVHPTRLANSEGCKRISWRKRWFCVKPVLVVALSLNVETLSLCEVDG